MNKVKILFEMCNGDDWVLKLIELECIENISYQIARRSEILPKNSG